MLQLEYALKEGFLVHISQVERGLKCACFCPSCNDPLIARKGKIKAHHFAHVSADCGHAVETALHMMAKEIIAEEKKIMLPEVRYLSDQGKYVVRPEGFCDIDEAFLETRQGKLNRRVLDDGRGWLFG